jgi:hypothetical protein
MGLAPDRSLDVHRNSPVISQCCRIGRLAHSISLIGKHFEILHRLNGIAIAPASADISKKYIIGTGDCLSSF